MRLKSASQVATFVVMPTPAAVDRHAVAVLTLFDITKVPEKELCEELRKLKPQERVKYVKEKLNQRLTLQKEITELSKKRDEYVKEETKKKRFLCLLL